MVATGNSIDILVDTPNDLVLTFLRKEITEHLEDYNFDAVQTLQWTGGIKVGEMPANIRILRAKRRREVYSGLINMTLEGIDLEGMVASASTFA